MQKTKNFKIWPFLDPGWVPRKHAIFSNNLAPYGPPVASSEGIRVGTELLSICMGGEHDTMICRVNHPPF